MNPKPESAPRPAAGRQRIANLTASVLGLGRLPFAPGTWGSLAGVGIYALIRFCLSAEAISDTNSVYAVNATGLFSRALPLAVLIAIVGVWASNSTAASSGTKDPQFVVIDEVSGQLNTYVVALAPANWKYLVLGFILFRVLDIWKPFPARQAESLPGGWGIMADDWVAGLYAAAGLWLARAAGI